LKSFEVENIKKGNVVLYEQLFKHYYEHLVYFSYRYVKDEQIAEDVVHDVFVNIWNNRNKLDFTLNFKSYLYSAVKNQSLKYIQRNKNFNDVDIEVIIVQKKDLPDNIAINNELEKAISKAISELPEKRREIFCMHRFDNLTYSEIALTLDISVKTVETQMSRALKYLRQQLKYLLK
jgi:RNA polymerase sigma-70 factor (ECF subfamily)